ncbi:MAG: hypothetical protein AMS24_00090 [Chlamydiae bacterium SM23_39]|nr:MAG: hypothetical protein AMS24_00090 [Chlamydiae bacterium SM23_39]
MKNLDYENMTAHCGLACFNYVVHLAKTDEDIRKHVAKQFNMPSEKIPGRRSVKGKISYHT